MTTTTSIQNFDSYLFHASAFSKLTTEPKSAEDKKLGNLSVTTKTYLRQIYLEEVYNRRKDIVTKQMRKGILQEEDAITLFCRVKKAALVKNQERLSNEFVTGEPDVTDNKDIYKTHRGTDTKCSWDIFSFPFPDDKLDRSYEEQNQVYMFLTGACEWSTAFCLVNATADQVSEEKKRLWYKLNQPEEIDDEYLKGCLSIERNMIYDLSQFKKDNPNFDYAHTLSDWVYDIPMKERVREFVSYRNDWFIDNIPSIAIKSRQYMNGLLKGIL